MPYFLKTEEIKGASKYPAYRHEIELLSFQKASDTEIEIAVSPAEIVAVNNLYGYVGNQNKKIAKAVVTTATGFVSLSTAGTFEMLDVTVTKRRLSANGVTFFTLSGRIVNTIRLRDPANGLPTGKRMHKPFVITRELDITSPKIINELVENDNTWEKYKF